MGFPRQFMIAESTNGNIFSAIIRLVGQDRPRSRARGMFHRTMEYKHCDREPGKKSGSYWEVTICLQLIGDNTILCQWSTGGVGEIILVTTAHATGQNVISYRYYREVVAVSLGGTRQSKKLGKPRGFLALIHSPFNHNLIRQLGLRQFNFSWNTPVSHPTMDESHDQS